MCTIFAHCPLTFACHFTHNQNDMQAHENNASKYSKCEPRHKHKQEPQDIA